MKLHLEEAMDEVQGEALDLQTGHAETLQQHLSSAVSCETVEDLRANLEEALDEVRQISEALRDLLRKVPKEGKST